jgi:hypothetical protein
MGRQYDNLVNSIIFYSGLISCVLLIIGVVFIGFGCNTSIPGSCITHTKHHGILNQIASGYDSNGAFTDYLVTYDGGNNCTIINPNEHWQLYQHVDVLVLNTNPASCNTLSDGYYSWKIGTIMASIGGFLGVTGILMYFIINKQTQPVFYDIEAHNQIGYALR